MARRAGCAVGLVFLVVVAAGTAFVWLVLSLLGVVGSAPFARAVAGTGLLLGVSALVLAMLALRRLAAPAGRIVEAAGRIEAGDFSARGPVRRPTGLRSVARGFNAVSSQLVAA